MKEDQWVTYHSSKINPTRPLRLLIHLLATRILRREHQTLLPFSLPLAPRALCPIIRSQPLRNILDAFDLHIRRSFSQKIGGFVLSRDFGVETCKCPFVFETLEVVLYQDAWGVYFRGGLMARAILSESCSLSTSRDVLVNSAVVGGKFVPQRIPRSTALSLLFLLGRDEAFCWIGSTVCTG